MLSPERSTSHNLFTTVTSKIPDHRSRNKYSNNEKAWNTARITKMRHRANAVCLSKYCWKNGVPWLVPHRVAINFQLTKKKKKKKMTLPLKHHKANKMRHADMKKPDSCLSLLGSDKQGPPCSPSRLAELLCQPTMANAPNFSRLFISPLFWSNNLK